MMKSAAVASLAAAAVLMTGCATHYSHRFAPAPVEVELYPDDQPEARARGLVTIGGIRRPADGRGSVVEVRIRIENIGQVPVALLADSLRLVSADLRDLGAATVVPAPEPLAAGQNGVYDVGFELRAGRTPQDYDLQGMNLKFDVDFAGTAVMTGITFDRVLDSPDGRPRFSFGVGYGYIR